MEKFPADLYNNLSCHKHIATWFDKRAKSIPARYAFVGSYALHQYVPERPYNDMNVLMREMDRKKIKHVFDVNDEIYWVVNRLQLRVPFNGSYTEINFHEVDSLDWILLESVDLPFDGTTARMATKEGLLYFYLFSDKAEHRADISLLLHQTDVSVDYVKNKLRLYDRFKAIEYLDHILEEENLIL